MLFFTVLLGFFAGAFLCVHRGVFLQTMSYAAAATPEVTPARQASSSLAGESLATAVSLEQKIAKDAQEKTTESPFDKEAQVKKWFEESASAFIRAHARDEFADMNSEDVAAIRVDTPVKVHEFSRVEKDGLTVVEANMWMAPLLLDTKTLGTLFLSFSSGQMETPVALRSVKLADALLQETPTRQVVYDSVTQGWYLAEDETIQALDAVSEAVIAGPVNFEQFQEIRKELQGINKGDSLSSDLEEKQEGGETLMKVAILALVFLLVVIGVMMWNRSVDSEKKLALLADKGSEQDRQKALREDDPHVGGKKHKENEDDDSDSFVLAHGDDPDDRSGPSERIIRSHTGEIVRVIEMPERKEGEVS